MIDLAVWESFGIRLPSLIYAATTGPGRCYGVDIGQYEPPMTRDFWTSHMIGIPDDNERYLLQAAGQWAQEDGANLDTDLTPVQAEVRAWRTWLQPMALFCTITWREGDLQDNAKEIGQYAMNVMGALDDELAVMQGWIDRHSYWRMRALAE